MSKAARFSLRALAAMTLLLGISAFAQDMHTSSQFQGPESKQGDRHSQRPQWEERVDPFGRFRRT